MLYAVIHNGIKKKLTNKQDRPNPWAQITSKSQLP
jgi:hypothetical protein